MKGLGQRIQILRKDKRLTLVEMARETGIDQATLSRIENGKMTGTLASHMKIAEALGVRLSDLYEETLARINEAKEKETRRKLETFSHSSGAVAEILTTGILNKKMVPLILKIKPRGRTAHEEYAPQAERFVYVLKGTAQIMIGSETQTLKTGESLYFNASAPHSFKNPAKIECWCLSVMTPASL